MSQANANIFCLNADANDVPNQMKSRLHFLVFMSIHQALAAYVQSGQETEAMPNVSLHYISLYLLLHYVYITKNM